MRKTGHKHNKEHFRIITALLLVILMAFSILPLSAFAFEAGQDNTENTPNSEVQAEPEGQDDETKKSEGKSGNTAGGSNTTNEDKDKSSDAGTTSDGDQPSTGEAGDSNTSFDEDENKDKPASADTTPVDDEQPPADEAGDNNTSTAEGSGSSIKDDEGKTDQLDELEISDNEYIPVGGPEEKAITLFQADANIGDFDSLQQVLDKMYELTKDGSKYNFTIQVNKDIALSEYCQLSFPYGPVILTSSDPANPRTIKANSVNHNTMLGVVNGGDLAIENIIIDGNNEARLLWIESTEGLPASLTINDGTILQNGKVQADDQTKHGGAIYCQGASILTINGGIIRNNEAVEHGGGICYIGTKTLTINGGEITGNKAAPSGSGGGVFLQRNGKISGGSIHDNTAKNGGGIATGTNANLELTGGKISDNTASYAGGGVYLFNNSVVKFLGGQISGNKGKYGGGVTAVYDSHFIMEGTGVISANEAYTGGGIYPWGTTPTCDLISGTIEKNQANFGGGIRLRSPKTKIGGVVIRENIANYGGGIYSSIPDTETLTIDGVQLIKNEALSGGGICLPQGGSLYIKNSHIEGNRAYYGGGVWTNLSMTLEKCSFNSNEAMKSDEPLTPDGKPENNGHGGAIYINTGLAENGEVRVDGCSFTNNTADKSGGAISVDETHGMLRVINNTLFDGNQATGALGHGGAIYSNWHPYGPDYDDGGLGPFDPIPTPDKFYTNIATDKTTEFKNNRAFQTFTPPSTKDKFIELQYKQTSHPGTQYDHPLNNDDVNFLAFYNVIFHKNYETDDPIHDAFLVLERSKFGQDLPAGPEREGYKFLGWNTQSDGKGAAFTADTVVTGHITLYAIWEAKPEPTPEPTPEATPIPDITVTPPSKDTLEVFPPVVFKMLAGGKPATADLFTFRLEALSYKPAPGLGQLLAQQVVMPMPTDSLGGVAELSISGEGTASFGQLTYTCPGDYHYQITEVKGNNPNYAYSQDVYSFTDHVYEENGKLVSSRTVYKNGVQANTQTAYFTNQYLGTVPAQENVLTLPATGSSNGLPLALSLAALGLVLLLKKR